VTADAAVAAEAAVAAATSASAAAASAAAARTPQLSPEGLLRALEETGAAWAEAARRGHTAAQVEVPAEVADLVLPPDRLEVSFDDVGSLAWVKEALHETVLLPLLLPPHLLPPP
jgi:SpoVK/Ycf46/Vps4 family AAA+-type ATPase